MASKGNDVIGRKIFFSILWLMLVVFIATGIIVIPADAEQVRVIMPDGSERVRDTDDGMTFTDWFTNCGNPEYTSYKTYTMDCEKSKPDCKVCETPVGGGETVCHATLTSAGSYYGPSGMVSYPNPTIDNLSAELFHHADDYISEISSKCLSCGGGAPNSKGIDLQMRRFHRSRDLVDYSAFGPGVYCSYDAKLKFYRQDAGNIIAVIDPKVVCPQTFVDGSIDNYFNSNDPKDGIYTSIQSKSAKEIRLLDSNGNLVVEPTSASKAVLTTLDGRKFSFDVVNMSVGSADLTNGLQLHLPFDETEGTTAADSSGNGRNGLIDGMTRWTTGRINGGIGEDLTSGTESSWVGTNVNSPVTAGSYTEDDGTWTVTGGGGAISYYTDQFYFVNKKLTGDGTIIARLASHNIPTSTSGRAGIMIRQTMENKSKCAVIETGYIDTSFGTRAGTGATMAFSTTYWALAPQWLKLVRSGDSFTGYRSTDGVNWIQQGTVVNIPMGDDVYVGMAVCAGDYSGARTVQAVFDNVSITGNTRDWSTATPGRVVTTGYKGIGGGNPRTVSAWIKTAQKGTIISWGNAATNKQFTVGLKDVNRWLYGALYAQAGTASKIGSNYVADARWHHIAVVLPDNKIENSLLYVDGVPEYIGSGTSAQVDTDNADGSDVIIGDNTSFTDPFKGIIDDVRIYSRALSAEEVAELSGQGDIEALSGRLTKIEDRNGYGTTVNYKAWSQQELSESPSRQYQIDTVSDSSGRTMAFQYGNEQVSGRWAVKSIDMPDGQKVNYNYSSGFISEVQRPDGTKASFKQTYDSPTKCTKFEFSDTSARPTHRKSNAYITNQITWTGRNGDIVPQATGMVRGVINPNHEMTYQNFQYGGVLRFVYEGGGKLYDFQRYQQATTIYSKSWTLNNSGSLNISSVVREPTYESITYNFSQWEAGKPPTKIDEAGRRTDYEYNSSSSPTKISYPDSTNEKYVYNDFQQVTRNEDRLGRVTRYTYDSHGNMLIKEVGIQVVSGQDVNQPEYAIYKWEYYPVGHVNQFKLRYEYDAVHDPNTQIGNRKEYIYNSNQLLIQVNEPDDTGSGYHTSATYTYDSAGRLLTSADACGRTLTYHYDLAGHVDKITYPDNSTELFIYDTDDNSPTKGLLIKQKDRNGSVTRNEYDDTDRLVKVTVAYSTMASDGSSEQVCDSSVQSITEYAYLCGTNHVASQTTNGIKTAYSYDYRNRLVSTTINPRDGVALTTQSVYTNNELAKTIDPYGRATYYVYRASDGAIVRTVRGAVPEDGITDPATAIRDSAPNAKYAITDMDLNAEGQVTKTIDSRAIIHTTEYDTRGRTTASVTAWGLRDYTQSPAADTQITNPKIAARSEKIYDSNSNIIETRSPRYFDSNDPAFQKARELMTYTQRNLLASRHVAPDVDDSSDLNKQNATEYYTYYADSRQKTHTNFSGNQTTNYYSPKCARLVFVKDAAGNGHITRTDFGGRTILTATVADASVMTDLDSFGNPTTQMMDWLLNPPTAAGLAAASTTKYDARNRPIAATTWLNYQPVTDRQNPTIAGDGNIPVADGLTNRFYYDDTIADGAGLDDPNAAINICSLKAKLADAGLTFAATGCAASATVVKSSAGGLSASISDPSGRTVIKGILDPANSCNPVSWNIATYDAINSIINFGTIVETARLDDLGNVSKSHSDALGRTIETIDVLNNKTAYTLDVRGCILTAKDANNIGSQYTYDVAGRLTESHIISADSSTPKISAIFYNADGNVIESRSYYDDTNYYSSFTNYDIRGRRIKTLGPDNVASVIDYDKLDQAICSRAFADATQNNGVIATLDTNLRTKSTTTYDSRGLVATNIAYQVNQSNGAVGSALTMAYWYDALGRQIKSAGANGQFIKTRYDFAGQTIATYNCYDVAENSDADASNVNGDTVIEQTKTIYDTRGLPVCRISFSRLDTDTTSNGELTASNSYINATVNWYDGMARISATTNYGCDNGSIRYVYDSNGNLIDSNADGIPDEASTAVREPNTSDDYIVSKYQYDSLGRLDRVTDNKGHVKKTVFDSYGRVSQSVENYVDGVATETETDTDLITENVYDSMGRLSQLRAYNPKGSGKGVEVQTTKYLFNSPLSSTWTTNVIYPDSSDADGTGVDQVKYTFDRLGRKISMTDQNGTVHQYAFDSAGRLSADAVTTVGNGIDTAILAIGRSYDDIGRMTKLTSYDATSNGNVVNEVKYEFDSYGNVSASRQAHTGAVDQNTPSVQYSYSDGATNGTAKYIRLTAVTYPAGRTIYRNYPASGVGEKLSRLDNIAVDANGTTQYAQYTYLGTDTIVKSARPGVTGGLNLNYGTGGNYSGFNKFGIVTDQKWEKDDSTVVDRVVHGYDRNMRRQWRQNLSPGATEKDEFYTYDGLDRLASFKQGTLNTGRTDIETPTKTQAWALEMLGNWASFNDNGNSQTRTHNAANETTGISGNWAQPAYDPAGNMTAGPKSGAEATKQHYKFDAWNRLVETRADSAGSPGDLIATYRYDANNLRIGKTIAGNPAQTFDYYYDGYSLIETRKDQSANAYEQYVMDISFVHAPVLRFRDADTDGANIETLYYTLDANCNVIALVDTTATTVERYTYDPYGKAQIFDGSWSYIGSSAYDNAVLYTGHKLDAETGLFYAVNRFYNPSLGCWISRDPYVYVDGMNWYAYVHGYPIGEYDPMGLNAADRARWSTKEAELMDDAKKIAGAADIFNKQREDLDKLRVLDSRIEHGNASAEDKQEHARLAKELRKKNVIDKLPEGVPSGDGPIPEGYIPKELGLEAGPTVTEVVKDCEYRVDWTLKVVVYQQTFGNEKTIYLPNSVTTKTKSSAEGYANGVRSEVAANSKITNIEHFFNNTLPKIMAVVDVATAAAGGVGIARAAAKELFMSAVERQAMSMVTSGTGLARSGVSQGTRTTAGEAGAGAGSSSQARSTGARILEPGNFDEAEAAYGRIRATSGDVEAIAENAGMSKEKIQRIKDHLFSNEHQLDDAVRRFDADPDIVNSWNRLQEGTHTSTDMQLLNHEYFESRFEGIFRTTYRTAHDAANRSGRTSGL